MGDEVQGQLPTRGLPWCVDCVVKGRHNVPLEPTGSWAVQGVVLLVCVSQVLSWNGKFSWNGKLMHKCSACFPAAGSAVTGQEFCPVCARPFYWFGCFHSSCRSGLFVAQALHNVCTSGHSGPTCSIRRRSYFRHAVFPFVLKLSAWYFARCSLLGSVTAM